MKHQESAATMHTTEGFPKRGIRLGDLVAREDVPIDRPTKELLQQLVDQYDFLAHVEMVVISPEDEHHTGGIFRLVQTDEGSFTPTMHIVAEDQAHMEQLMASRAASVASVANVLGIDNAMITPTLLRQFIIAHEAGHAADYVRNYETNPEYKGDEAVEEWKAHYQATLSSLPVSGFDPAELQEEIARRGDAQGFVVTRHPDQALTIAELLHAQEIAYRESPYESYADTFAAKFLKRNADVLHIRELSGNVADTTA